MRHRQTKGAATDMFGLQPLRHISTLPDPADPRRYRGRPAASQNGFVYSFGTGIGLVTLLQPLICSPCSLLFGFPETMASMSSGDGAEPRLSPATISQVRRQGHPRQQRFDIPLDRVRSRRFRCSRAFIKLLRHDLAYCRKTDRCFKTELENLSKGFGVTPNSG